MSQPNQKSQHLEQQQEEKGNGKELGKPEMNMAALQAKNLVLSESMSKMKEENGALGEKLNETEPMAQIAKNELGELIMTSRQKEEETTSSSSRGGVQLNLELEITQNLFESHRRVPLPLELNCQIFECLKFENQRKFIGGLGRGIYGIFRQKSKRLRNPLHNGWNKSSTNAIIYSNGLLASDNTNTGNWQNVFAKKGFPITGGACSLGRFPGTILYYFEVTIIFIPPRILAWADYALGVGLSAGTIYDGFSLGFSPNSYGFSCCSYYYYLTGKVFEFKWPKEAKWKSTGNGNVTGCGILLNPMNKLSIFFTLNGTLLDKQIPISPSVDCLFPTLCLKNLSVEANFGTDPTKPFKYDIKKCPGMGYDD